MRLYRQIHNSNSYLYILKRARLRIYLEFGQCTLLAQQTTDLEPRFKNRITPKKRLKLGSQCNTVGPRLIGVTAVAAGRCGGRKRRDQGFVIGEIAPPEHDTPTVINTADADTGV